jgi:DNA-binding cell septation regulator SpoVG
MIYIKKFLDKLSIVDGKNKDIVLPIDDARGLRDELNKLIVDNYELLKQDSKKDTPVQVIMNGGKW